MGSEIFQQGTPAESVYFLRQGLVKLQRTQADGREVIVGLRGSGWLLGAAAALQESVYAATPITLIPCQIMHLGAPRFRTLVQRNASFSWGLHRMHSSEVYSQVCQLGDLGALSARQRLEQLFADLAPALGVVTDEAIPFELPLRQWEIAQLIAVTPPYLSELLGELEREGVLFRQHGKMTVVLKSE